MPLSTSFLRGLLSPALPFGFGGWFFLPTYSSSGASTAGKESFPSPLVEPGAARLLITNSLLHHASPQTTALCLSFPIGKKKEMRKRKVNCNKKNRTRISQSCASIVGQDIIWWWQQHLIETATWPGASHSSSLRGASIVGRRSSD